MLDFAYERWWLSIGMLASRGYMAWPPKDMILRECCGASFETMQQSIQGNW